MKPLALLSILLIASISALAQSYCFSVKVVGTGKPVILIPGLTCTGDVWDGTVAQLQSKYECHVLTLPGFGKQPPISGPYISHVRDDIIAYVKDKKLDHPAIVGHSLGGFMVYYLAEAEPKLWGPLISVDGLPFLAAIYQPSATAESIKPTAEKIAKQMSGSTPDVFKAGVRSAFVAQITDPKNIEAMYAFASQSNQANVAQAFEDMFTPDLRAGLSTVQSPLLLIGAGQQAVSADLKQSLTSAYRAQVKALPTAKVVMDWKAKHFVMLDDPTFFYKTVIDFLAAN